MGDDFGGALWLLVAVDSALFIVFGLSFFHPSTKRDWRVMGSYSALVIALFAEMYGFPLTVYLMSGWMGSSVPALAPTHAGAHLLNDLIGWQGDPHLSPIHVVSYVVMGAGFVLLSRAWPALWRARKEHRLAVTGPYARLRHPQYAGILLIMVAFLLQWPTLVTAVMFPVLAVAYRRLAIAEEREVETQFPDEYAAYERRTPRFIPRLGRSHRVPS